MAVRRLSPADEPAYTIADAARFLHLAPSTLSFWVKGGNYPKRGGRPGHSPPVIKLADPNFLSFRNLAEAYVLRGLRRSRQMLLPDVRGAVKFLARELRDEHPLVHPDVRVHGKELLIQRYGKLISATKPGQLVLESLQAHLERLIWKGDTIARFFPFIWDQEGALPSREQPKVVLIDPTVAYGRPFVGDGIRTRIISERWRAGDTIQRLSEDYETSAGEIEEALRYEQVGARYEEAA